MDRFSKDLVSGKRFKAYIIDRVTGNGIVLDCEDYDFSEEATAEQDVGSSTMYPQSYPEVMTKKGALKLKVKKISMYARQVLGGASEDGTAGHWEESFWEDATVSAVNHDVILAHPIIDGGKPIDLEMHCGGTAWKTLVQVAGGAEVTEVSFSLTGNQTCVFITADDNKPTRTSYLWLDTGGYTSFIEEDDENNPVRIYIKSFARDQMSGAKGQVVDRFANVMLTKGWNNIKLGMHKFEDPLDLEGDVLPDFNSSDNYRRVQARSKG